MELAVITCALFNNLNGFQMYEPLNVSSISNFGFNFPISCVVLKRNIWDQWKNEIIILFANNVGIHIADWPNKFYLSACKILYLNLNYCVMKSMF